MESVIYYFSATGNSFKVAKDLAAGLENTQLIKICKDNYSLNTNKQYKKIGIVFPVYYYGLPIMVKEFVERMNFHTNCYVYTVATCGGSVGSAISQLKDILKNKSTILASAFSIVMPDNYQVLFSQPSKEKQHKLFNLQQKKIGYILENIKNQSLIFQEDNNIFTKLLGGTIYRTFKPYEKDKNFWTQDSCNGCGICTKVCPANNIVLDNDRPQWLHKCEHCLACMHWCPKQALQYKKGTIKRERYQHPEIKITDLISSKPISTIITK